jgi:hypothetical protein
MDGERDEWQTSMDTVMNHRDPLTLLRYHEKSNVNSTMWSILTQLKK